MKAVSTMTPEEIAAKAVSTMTPEEIAAWEADPLHRFKRYEPNEEPWYTVERDRHDSLLYYQRKKAERERERQRVLATSRVVKFRVRS